MDNRELAPSSNPNAERVNEGGPAPGHDNDKRERTGGKSPGQQGGRQGQESGARRKSGSDPKGRDPADGDRNERDGVPDRDAGTSKQRA